MITAIKGIVGHAVINKDCCGGVSNSMYGEF